MGKSVLTEQHVPDEGLRHKFFGHKHMCNGFSAYFVGEWRQHELEALFYYYLPCLVMLNLVKARCRYGNVTSGVQTFKLNVEL